MDKKTKYGIAALVVIVLLVGFTMFFPKGLLEKYVTQMEEQSAVQEEVVVEAPSYVEMETLSIPVIDQGTIKNTMFLTLQLDVAKEDFADVKRDLRKIRDIVLMDMHDYLPKHMHENPRPDLYVIKQHLAVVIGRASQGKVRDVVVKGSFNR